MDIFFKDSGTSWKGISAQMEKLCETLSAELKQVS